MSTNTILAATCWRSRSVEKMTDANFIMKIKWKTWSERSNKHPRDRVCECVLVWDCVFQCVCISVCLYMCLSLLCVCVCVYSLCVNVCVCMCECVYMCKLCMCLCWKVNTELWDDQKWERQAGSDKLLWVKENEK